MLESKEFKYNLSNKIIIHIRIKYSFIIYNTIVLFQQ